jgi:hypothetical protein
MLAGVPSTTVYTSMTTMWLALLGMEEDSKGRIPANPTPTPPPPPAPAILLPPENSSWLQSRTPVDYMHDGRASNWPLL